MIRKALVIGGIIFVIACVASGEFVRLEKWPTVQITNESGGPIAVYLRSHRIGTADPGRSCIRLRFMPSGTQQLGLREVAGEMFYTPPEALGSREGWQLRLTHNMRFDVLSLEPAPRCT